jgi:hypothetical protein
MTVTPRSIGALVAAACITAIVAAPTSAAELELPGSRPVVGDQSPTSSPPASAAEVDPAAPPADNSVIITAGPESVPVPARNTTVLRRRPLPNSSPRADAMVGVGYGF